MESGVEVKIPLALASAIADDYAARRASPKVPKVNAKTGKTSMVFSRPMASYHALTIAKAARGFAANMVCRADLLTDLAETYGVKL